MLFIKSYFLYIKINEDEIIIFISGVLNWVLVVIEFVELLVYVYFL